ncbi:hypothetical protein [Streptomonospora wellingtoniae]|uniref:MerR family transcriptional regulator n=1 Tax=Streptomonospora wellingtoniae TaxID=3075544 RepID=A0ABU2L0P0_9ACTN|nr:hypothetical protein [Streptomonospora sp. DSM 45055]MDT0305082.1 hypothetical protein [Streptomonospora sp. DSM 45055]
MSDIGVTAAEAAVQVGVTRATIDTWVHRGHLTPIPDTSPRRYWLTDVFAAESGRQRTMRRPKRPATIAKDQPP